MEIREFSATDLSLLSQRQLSTDDISAFKDILTEAKNSHLPKHQFLLTLEPTDLAILQKANGLAEPIAVNNLTAEGATNLFATPSGEGVVDLNNDGIVKIGEANTLHFPPVNAPQYVKDAWNKATEGLDFFDKATMELTMHHMVYGVQLDGIPSKSPQSPSQQWSVNGLSALFGDLYSNLDFRVGMDGWTERNLSLQSVYQTFETALEQYFDQEIQPKQQSTEVNTNASSSGGQSTNLESQDKPSERLEKLNQLLLDARIGLDREKIKALEKKMEAVLNDPSLTPKQKTLKLQALQSEIEQVIEEARRRAVEEEKRKSTLNQSERLGEAAFERKIKKNITEFL